MISVAYGESSEEATGAQAETHRKSGRSTVAALQGGGQSAGEIPVGVSRRSAPGKATARRLLIAAISAGVAFCAEPSTVSRTIQVHKQDIVAISTAFRYTTLIELPAGEDIMDATCGDKSYWAVNYSKNLVFIKPLGDKGGEHTNINLVSASGNVYSFLVREVSADPNEHADLKVFVETPDAEQKQNVSHPQFVERSQLDEAKKELEVAQKKINTTQTSAATKELGELKFDYSWPHNKVADTFRMHAIWHDNAFTFISADPQEVPALYELKDGKEMLVQYQFSNGLYTIPKILDDGYLRVGKSKLEFHREQGS